MYVYFYNKTGSWLVNDRLKLKISSEADLTFFHAVKGLRITSSIYTFLACFTFLTIRALIDIYGK